jgi:peptide/nickel transport system substrate-binding protein
VEINTEETQEVSKPSGSFWLLPLQKKAALALSSFSKTEKILFWTFLVCAILSGIAIFSHINQSYMVSVPRKGGSFTEGIVGTPRFINPVLALSDADKDLTSLIYSGLLRVGKDGELIPDLAEKYELSLDGLVYTFTLKENLTWSDGTPLTASDVKFTIEKIQDPNVRSPKKSAWDGVTAAAPDARTVTFTLKKPYAPFLENATIGILPKAIWGSLSAEEFGFSSYNTNPVGSGSYKIGEVSQNSSGIPEFYDLVPFEGYVLGAPFISHVQIRFYTGEEKLIEAYKNGQVEAISAISPQNALALSTAGSRVETAPLPRTFGVFLNQNEQEIFIDPSVRLALNESVDKDFIINSVLYGFASKIDGPLPPGVIGFNASGATSTGMTSTSTPEDRIIAARNILTKNGWVYNEEKRVMEKTPKGNGKKTKSAAQTLSFSLSTSDAPELRKVAEILKQEWENMGAQVELKVFESGDLNQNIIRPRKYDALLFGEIVGRDPDPYAFWHSSQRFDPGLNIALYTSIPADKLLEKARGVADENERALLYQSFETEVKRDSPVIFLYSPRFIYVLPKNLQGLDISGITLPTERFSNIKDWYKETQNVWKIFAPK